MKVPKFKIGDFIKKEYSNGENRIGKIVKIVSTQVLTKEGEDSSIIYYVYGNSITRDISEDGAVYLVPNDT